MTQTIAASNLALIKDWAQQLGFQDLGICDVNLGPHQQHLQDWLNKGFQGEMDYMARHGEKRSQPDKLIEGTLQVISVRMDYLTLAARDDSTDKAPQQARISRYAQGRDYHKLIRKRLSQLAEKIEQELGGGQFRAFVDSAPVLERALAEKAGLGWIGKNCMLISPNAGSYYFLGEIYTNMPLPQSEPFTANHCGSCTSCLEACPTQAFVAPYQLDARKCISYLTIELKGSIPESLRAPMGNRIFGCDECQTACPWNKFSQPSAEADFQPRNDFDSIELIELFNWSESEFLERTAGSAIRRTGYQGWMRNIAVALGNCPPRADIIDALTHKRCQVSELVQEHIDWALNRQRHPQTIPVVDSAQAPPPSREYHPSPGEKTVC